MVGGKLGTSLHICRGNQLHNSFRPRHDTIFFCFCIVGIFLLTSCTGVDQDQEDHHAVLPLEDVLRISPAAVDFGSVARGSTHRQAIEITNVSDDRVTLLDAHSDCDSVVVDVIQRTLDPGESLEIVVQWTPLETSRTQLRHLVEFGVSERDSLGKLEILGTVLERRRTDRDRQVGIPIASATMTGGETSLQPFPRRVNLGAVALGTSTYQEIVVRNGLELNDGNAPVLYSEAYEFDLSVDDWEIRDGMLTILLRFTPLAVGRIRERVTIEFGGGVGSFEMHGHVTAVRDH